MRCSPPDGGRGVSRGGDTPQNSQAAVGLIRRALPASGGLGGRNEGKGALAPAAAGSPPPGRAAARSNCTGASRRPAGGALLPQPQPGPGQGRTAGRRTGKGAEPLHHSPQTVAADSRARATAVGTAPATARRPGPQGGSGGPTRGPRDGRALAAIAGAQAGAAGCPGAASEAPAAVAGPGRHVARQRDTDDEGARLGPHTANAPRQPQGWPGRPARRVGAAACGCPPWRAGDVRTRMAAPKGSRRAQAWAALPDAGRTRGRPRPAPEGRMEGRRSKPRASATEGGPRLPRPFSSWGCSPAGVWRDYDTPHPQGVH